MFPIADFLAGALLSLLLPTLLLIALVAWYMMFLRRVPDTDESELVGAPANRGPDPAPDAATGTGAKPGDG